jgi:PhzF family phenazine biosynthesis protein
MQVQQVTCFGARAGEGNPALVVQGGPADAASRQAFAQDSGVSACVFIDDDGDPRSAQVLDYYYPHMRSPLCLHATLAAAHVLFAQQGSSAPLTVKTALRGQVLALSREGDELFVALTRQQAEAVAPPAEQVAALLSAPGLVLRSAPVVASVGSPKLLVEVADPAILAGLRPDLPGIVAWGRGAGVNGVYAYCRLEDGSYEGRNFNHLDPAQEDSATGVAAGALSVRLGRGITLRQGGGRCLIRTRMQDDTILVGGRAF